MRDSHFVAPMETRLISDLISLSRPAIFDLYIKTSPHLTYREWFPELISRYFDFGDSQFPPYYVEGGIHKAREKGPSPQFR